MAKRDLTPQELREIQLTELELLTEVDRICRMYDIHYNIIAGTLLGAVRHKGFIPWDDDADVAMIRSEYDRFVNACHTELDQERFYFQDMDVETGYRWGYGKLRRKNTLFLREFQEHMPYEQGIFIDIFPLDGVPDLYPFRVLKNLECFCVRKILWSPVGSVAEENKAVRCLYQGLSKIPLNLVRRYYHHMIRRAGKKTDYVRILTFPTPNRTYGYLRSWYMESKDYCFEERCFKGISEYDAYLHFKYGDYNKLPAEEERKTHPVSALKLCSCDE